MIVTVCLGFRLYNHCWLAEHCTVLLLKLLYQLSETEVSVEWRMLRFLTFSCAKNNTTMTQQKTSKEHRD